MNDFFRRFSKTVSDLVGTPVVFAAAVLIIIAWGLTGPFFGFSDTWQLIINTSTTIVTFLVVFLIQNTQNRNDEATQLKLDELIHAIKSARNRLIDLEDLSDAELRSLEQQFQRIRNRSTGGKKAAAHDKAGSGGSKTGRRSAAS